MIQDTADERTKKRKRTFIERLAERVGECAKSTTIYSAPVQSDGVTVIPVAKVRWGFGGGSGRKSGKRGKGGGGGVQVSPLGYIEMKDGRSEYKPIRDPANLAPLMVIGGVVGWVLLRGLRKLIRGR